MIVSAGGGNVEEGEIIEVVYIPVEKALDFMMQDCINKPGGVLTALMWFYTKKLHITKQ